MRVQICPKKALDQVDEIKKITGEDPVKAEYKGGNHSGLKAMQTKYFQPMKCQ